MVLNKILQLQLLLCKTIINIGLLKVEDSEGVLLDIRQTKLLCEESK